MQCKNCEYPLWNLKTRQCPECGTSFRPSEHEFVPNSVRFDCPDCGQSYYGRGALGHLEPSAFECVKCNRALTMDEMVLRPAGDLDDRQTRPDRMPWLERRERGFVKAWFATLLKAMVQPGPMMKGVPATSPVKTAWWFTIVTQLAIMLLALLPSMCVMALLPAFTGATRQGGPSIYTIFGMMGAFSGATMVLAVVFTLAFIAIWGLITHGVLMATGGASATIGRTYQALCYSSGANAITIVPCIGPYVGWIWWVVSAVLALREAQKVHGGRATLAVLALPVSAIVLFGSLYAALILSILSGTSASSAGTVIMAPQAETATLAGMISTYAADHDDIGPAHLAVVMAENESGPGIFFSTSGATSSEVVPLADTTLTRVQRQGPNLQRITAKAAAADLPADVVAHRLGDFVYTGHGIDFDQGDGGLWIVILSLDPVANPSLVAAPIYCARLDGTVRRVSADQVASTLASQNALRADHGLGPLPDPASVTHAAPAAASSPP